jgi:hypothetical protein
MSTFDDAMAVAAAAMDAPAEAPASAPADTSSTEAPATEAAPATEEAAPKVSPSVLETLRKRKEAAAARTQAERDRQELADLKAKLEKQTQGPGGLDPKALMRDPVKALEAAGIDPTTLLNTLSKHAVTPDAAAIESRFQAAIDARDAKIAALEQRLDARDSEHHHARANEGHERAKKHFIDHTADKSKYPSLAKLSDARRAERGTKKAQELLASGLEDFDLEHVAQLVEEDLHGELSELLGRDPREPSPASDEPTPSPAATTGRTAAPAKRPNTITSDAASSTATTPRAMTEKERVAAAIAVANRK